MLKRTLSQVALAVAALTTTGAQAALTDGHFGASQIFDVQYYWSGTTLNASNFIQPYDMNFTHPTLGAGQYYAFFASTTNPGTYGLGIYNSNGTRASVVHDTGTLQAIGPNALFYIGSGFFGTVITTGAGYAIGSSASFTNMNTNPSAGDITGYTWASTTPLAAGQTAAPSAPPAPTTVVVSPGTTYTNASGTTLNPANSAGITVTGSGSTTVINNGTIAPTCGDNTVTCGGIYVDGATSVTINNTGNITPNVSAVTGNGNPYMSAGIWINNTPQFTITNSGNIITDSTQTMSGNSYHNGVGIGINNANDQTVGTINNSGYITEIYVQPTMANAQQQTYTTGPGSLTVTNDAGGTIGSIMSQGINLTVTNNGTIGDSNYQGIINWGTQGTTTVVNNGTIIGGIYALVANVTNNGDLTGVNRFNAAPFGLRVQGDANTVVNNYGNITSPVSSGLAISAFTTYPNGTPTQNAVVGGVVNNFGTITGGTGGPGIAVASNVTGVTITNTGTITGGMTGILGGATSGYTLNSSQASLAVGGKLPVNFNTIVNSTSSYGQLVLGNGMTGSMNFGIYGGGVTGVSASTLTNYRYVGVLQNVDSATWANISGSTGTYNGYSYSLVQNGNDYDLQVGPTGPTITGTTTSSTVTTSTANGASTTTTTYSNGTSTSTTTYANGVSSVSSTTANDTPVVTTSSVSGTPTVTQSSAVVRGAETSKTLAVNQVLNTTTITPTITTTTTTTPTIVTTVTTTPVTATTVTTTPVTATTVTTTPTTVTTTTTPVTTVSYSDNTQVSTNGQPTVTTAPGTPIVSTTTAAAAPIVTTATSAGTPIVTTATSAGAPIVAQNVVVNNGTPVNTSAVTASYSTRIDGYSRITQSSGFINNAMTGGVAERFMAGENGIKQRTGAFGDEKQGWMYVIGEGTPGTNSDGYKNKNGIYGLGYERLVRSDLLVGASYATAQSTLTGDQASAQVDKQIGTVYGLYTKNGWTLNTTLGHSDNKFYNTHSITALNLQNSGTTTGTDTWLHNRLYTPAYNNFKLLAGVRTDQTRADGFSENGQSITAMSYAKVQQTTTTTEYGARWDKQVGPMMLGAEYSMNSANLQTTTVMVGFTPRSNVMGAIGVRNQRQDGVENTTVVTNITVRF